MPREQQETVAKVLISAFLDSTLKEKKNYQKIFQDLGYAKKSGFLTHSTFLIIMIRRPLI